MNRYGYFLIILSALILITSVYAQDSASANVINTNESQQQILKRINCPPFAQYNVDYNKGYVSGTKEYEQREKIYNAKVQDLIRKTRDPGVRYDVGCNRFTDQSEQQRQHRKPLLIDQKQHKLATESGSSNKQKLAQSFSGRPLNLDWRQRGVITPIRDQGKCGACWTFATNAYGQSRMLMKNMTSDRDINLSEQYLLKCTPQCDCQGGYLQYVFQKAAGGVPLQQQYPYRPYFPSSPFICWTSKKQYFGYIPQKYYDLDTAQMQKLLQTGPVAISISATDWQDYKGGVYRCKPYDKVNHAVLLVGYTPDYWIVKNQWGANWGEQGYIRVDKNRLNNCKIGTSAFVMWGGWCLGVWVLVLGAIFVL